MALHNWLTSAPRLLAVVASKHLLFLLRRTFHDCFDRLITFPWQCHAWAPATELSRLQCMFLTPCNLPMQVLSMKQAGEVMVHSHPKMPVLEDMLNTFASERGYPADCDLVANAHTTSMQAEWAAFWQYTQLVNPDVAPQHDYVPFCDRSHGNLFGKFQSIQSFKASSRHL